MIRRLAFLHWLQLGAVRQLQRYYQDAMTSCCPSRRTSFPSLGDTTVRRSFVSPQQESTRLAEARGLWVRRPPWPLIRWRRQSLSRSRGILLCIRPALRPRRDRARQAKCGETVLPPQCPKRRLPHGVFRGSITRPLHSLSTLRHAGYPDATQDSLPPAGHALTGGIRTRWIHDERFQLCFLHCVLLSRAP